MNLDIKEHAKRNKVFLWRVADELGIQDSALSRKLRRELPPEEKYKIIAVIDRLAKGER